MNVPTRLADMVGATLQVWPGETYHVPTRAFKLGEGNLPESGAFFRDLLGEGPCLLLQDENTEAIAGAEVLKSLKAAGVKVIVHTLKPEPGEDKIEASGERVAEVEEALAGMKGTIAVGSGTINDLAKYASHQRGIPYGVVGTAASMNGYTSAIAAILMDGIKRTLPCTPPVGVYADLNIVASAPPALTQAGLGDLLSKPVSSGDWKLAHILLGEPFSETPLKIVDVAFRKVQEAAEGIGRGEAEAIGYLLEALILSGISMASAGTSSPASGGEHLISHYWDMVAPHRERKIGLHGAQVGVTTLISATLYQHLKGLKIDDAFIEERMSRYVEAEEYAKGLSQCPESLREGILKEVRVKYPSREVLKGRLEDLKEKWGLIWATIGAGLKTPEELRSVLEAGGAPTNVQTLGVPVWEAEEAFTRARDIRSRYTILDLAFDLGVLESFKDDVLRESGVLSGGAG